MAPQPFPLSAPVREKLELLGQEFLAEILGREVERHPSNFDALADLASVLTRLGRLEQGLQVDLQLSRLAPEDCTVLYNLGCSYALLERTDAALDTLEKAIELGYQDADQMLADEDLAALRDEYRFCEMVRRLQAEERSALP